MSRHVVPDEVSVKVPYPDYEDRRALNRQTAYGRPALEGSSRRCGCFHCGSSFAASEIKDWMPEEDGADTALCPYCGCDSVVFGMVSIPLSSSLLSTYHSTAQPRELRQNRSQSRRSALRGDGRRVEGLVLFDRLKRCEAESALRKRRVGAARHFRSSTRIRAEHVRKKGRRHGNPAQQHPQPH